MRRLSIVSLSASLVAALALACGSDPSALTGSPQSPASDPSDPPVSAANLPYNKNLPKKGDVLPTFAGVTLDGTRLGNADLSGKTTLITLWFYG